MLATRYASTDAGLRLLQATLRHAVLGFRAARLAPGRIHLSTLGSSDPRELALQAGFLRLVSITEATVDALGNELTTGAVGQADEVVRLLMLEKELASSSNWAARRKSFKRHHDIDLNKCAEWKRVEGAIEVRNAIAHGLGRLTTRQVESSETPKLLDRVGVAVVNGYVELEVVHLRDCASYAAAFIQSLDSSIP